MNGCQQGLDRPPGEQELFYRIAKLWGYRKQQIAHRVGGLGHWGVVPHGS
jgi:hypothetical protein